MGDTGSTSMGVTLAIVALYTNTVFILPFVGFIFVVEALSTIIQLLSKKISEWKKSFFYHLRFIIILKHLVGQKQKL